MNKPELLAPAGDFECLKAAVQNGADSVYLGAATFSARASAGNFDIEELEKAITYAKLRGVNVHLALNTVIKQNEFEEAIKLAKKAYELGIDAIIVQDLGLAKTLIKTFPKLPIHASTQMTVHNLEGVKKLEELGFKRIVLSRELSFNEIQKISKNTNAEIEAFVHGALCVSYSGQCLFSSMIGGRSGNRGKCAGPCRLPYELVNETNKTLDNGYILSPKDLYGLEYLPQFVEAGVKCFKIEGRMKTPEYVATVTRIYRKYLDIALKQEETSNYKIEEEDKEDLLQVFNRGGFSRGYLKEENNENFIYKEKPNHMGIYLGKITKFNNEKGYIELELKNEIAIGDKIAIDNNGISNNYNVSELLVNDHNSPYLGKNTKATLGRMKGKIFIGDKVYKLESKYLNELATKSYQNVENKRIPLGIVLDIKEGKGVEIKVFTKNLKDTIFNNLLVEINSNIVPEAAIKAPITEKRITEQLLKTKNTIYDFKDIKINLNEEIFLTIGMINELKRLAIEKVEEIAMSRIKRSSTTVTIPAEKEEIFKTSINNKLTTTPKISVLLNILNEEEDYKRLQNIDKIYIPFKYFIDNKYKKATTQICNKYATYIYLPTITKKNYQNLLNLQVNIILNNFKIQGFVVSNIGQIELVQKYNLELIANYTLNIYNNYTINELKDMGFNTFTISPEIEKEAIQKLDKTNNLELIVYGNTVVMNSNYCVVGKNTNCNSINKTCDKPCKRKEEKYYLKDRLNLMFRVISDNIGTISTIYNSKITSITWGEIEQKNLRIDILDEDITQINQIIEKVKKDEKLEGKNYTNGNLNRII